MIGVIGRPCRPRQRSAALLARVRAFRLFAPECCAERRPHEFTPFVRGLEPMRFSSRVTYRYMSRGRQRRRRLKDAAIDEILPAGDFCSRDFYGGALQMIFTCLAGRRRELFTGDARARGG